MNESFMKNLGQLGGLAGILFLLEIYCRFIVSKMPKFIRAWCGILVHLQAGDKTEMYAFIL